MAEMSDFFQDMSFLLMEPYILILFAFSLDMAIGDPLWMPHPVRALGWLIVKAEAFLRSGIGFIRHDRERKRKAERLAGMVLVLFVVTLTYSSFYTINFILINSQFHLAATYMSFIILVFLVSSTISTKGLIQAGSVIVDALEEDDIETARNRVGEIVGRDTDCLDGKGVMRAMIESLSENASDGIIAPLFYFALGGLPLAMTYKAVNTMDSIMGYRNERYRDFGWAAARLDDVANYIPARITGIIIIISSAIVSLSPLVVYRSLKTLIRDGRKHPSPNSGMPEAAMAGALGIKLGGPSTYGGILMEKPYIGEDLPRKFDKSKKRFPSYVKLGSSFPALQGTPFMVQVSQNAIHIVELTAVFGLIITILIQFARG